MSEQPQENTKIYGAGGQLIGDVEYHNYKYHAFICKRDREAGLHRYENIGEFDNYEDAEIAVRDEE